jgi:hypothetical protein
VLRPHYQFVIDVRQGRGRVSRGQATALFVRDVEEVFRDYHLASGSVRGMTAGRRTILRFSRHIPEPCRQRIRNLFQLHG